MNLILATKFLNLVDIMSKLRKECPWDKKQTIQTLRNMSIEELYELIDEIDLENFQGIKEELGDVLLHILFYTEIAQETNQFNLIDVLDNITKKLIDRHPHIFGNTKVANEAEVKANWEKIKKNEGRTSMLSGVPKTLPSINKALLIQNKAKQIGFEWENSHEVLDKVKEEIQEFHQACISKNKLDMEEEFGDILFSLINYARFIKINPDQALEKTNTKFIQRFQMMEELALVDKLDIASLSLDSLNMLWEKAKLKLA